MPNWKKIVTSGSDASLNSLQITGAPDGVSETNDLLVLRGLDSYADIILTDSGGSGRFRLHNGAFKFYTGGSAHSTGASGAINRFTLNTNGSVEIKGTADEMLKLQVDSSDVNDWNYIGFYGINNIRDSYIGTDGSGNSIWNDITSNSIMRLVSGGATLNGSTVYHAGNISNNTLNLKSGSGIKGTGTGTANSSWLGFYESNGTTRQGYIGFGSNSDGDLHIANNISSKTLRLAQAGALIYDDGFAIETIRHSSDRSSRIYFRESSLNSNYGLSIGYSGESPATNFPSGATNGGANGNWYIRRHNNNLNGSVVISGTRYSNNVNFYGHVITNDIRSRSGQQVILNAGESHNYNTGQTNEFVYINAENGLEINASPDNWASGWAGRITTLIDDTGITHNGVHVINNTGDFIGNKWNSISYSNSGGIDKLMGDKDFLQISTAGDGMYIRLDENASELIVNGDIRDTSGYNFMKQGYFQVNAISSTSYSLVQSDKGVVKNFSSASAITYTINSNSLTNIGDIAYIDQDGTGEITILAGSGVTLKKNSSRQLKTDGQYSRVAIHKVGSATYRVFGELKPV